MQLENVLQNAYSSKLRLEKRDDHDVIVKSVDAQERKSEIAFHQELKKLGLPAMEMAEEGDDLVIRVLQNVQTLEEAESVEVYRSLGSLLKVLHSKTFDEPFWVDAQGDRQRVTWDAFLQHQAEIGVQRQKDRGGLAADIADRAAKRVLELPASNRAVLVHGDLHANNVLVSRGEVYVFDKGDRIFAGDPMYDLGLFGITLPGLYGLGSKVKHDQDLWGGFAEGYGIDVFQDRGVFDRYVLLRCLERWPNPFESETPSIVETILENIGE